LKPGQRTQLQLAYQLEKATTVQQSGLPILQLERKPGSLFITYKACLTIVIIDSINGETHPLKNHNSYALQNRGVHFVIPSTWMSTMGFVQKYSLVTQPQSYTCAGDNGGFDFCGFSWVGDNSGSDTTMSPRAMRWFG